MSGDHLDVRECVREITGETRGIELISHTEGDGAVAGGPLTTADDRQHEHEVIRIDVDETVVTQVMHIPKIFLQVRILGFESDRDFFPTGHFESGRDFDGHGFLLLGPWVIKQ